MSAADAAGPARRHVDSGKGLRHVHRPALRRGHASTRARSINLYKYKKYTDVRLVFAPEFDIAFFGGDPDNFNYPRYDLDISFFRVYENGKPAQLDNYLKWSPDRCERW